MAINCGTVSQNIIKENNKEFIKKGFKSLFMVD